MDTETIITEQIVNNNYILDKYSYVPDYSYQKIKSSTDITTTGWLDNPRHTSSNSL